MRLTNLFAVIIFLVVTTSVAVADVSNEVIAGLEGDSSSEVTQDGADMSDIIKESNSTFAIMYSHFFTSLKNDDRPVDLRKFYQHPSLISAGLIAIGIESEDKTDPSKVDMSASALSLGAEYYLPSNTGLLIGLGGGSGEMTLNSGSFETKADIDLNTFDLGIRQYAAENVALHLRISGEEISGDLTGASSGSIKEKRTVTLIGGQFVFSDIVGLMLEFGRGKKESESSFYTPDKYDVADVKAEVTIYAGKQLSVLLGVDLSGEFQYGTPSGYDYEQTRGKVRLAPRYWFNENLGMEIGIYSITTETTTVTPWENNKETIKSNGASIFLGYRF